MNLCMEKGRKSAAKVPMKPLDRNNGLSTLLVIRTWHKVQIPLKCIYASTEASEDNFSKTRKRYVTQAISSYKNNVFVVT